MAAQTELKGRERNYVELLPSGGENGDCCCRRGKKRPLDLNFVDSVLFIWDLVQVLFSSLTFTSEKLWLTNYPVGRRSEQRSHKAKRQCRMELKHSGSSFRLPEVKFRLHYLLIVAPGASHLLFSFLLCEVRITTVSVFHRCSKESYLAKRKHHV